VSKKRALGQGLNAILDIGEGVDIIADDFTPSVSSGRNQIQYIEIDSIFPNPHQPRRIFQEEPLEELAESIKQRGIIQPILVENNGDGTYLIIAGERRYRASRLAGLEKIPTIVNSYTEEEKLEIALIENIQREDLTPIEEGRAYRHMMETLQITQQEVSEKVGKSRSAVANFVRLLKLPEDMQESLTTGILTAGHARALLATINQADQRVLFGKILEDRLSVRETESLSTELNKGNRPGSRGVNKNDYNSRDPEILSIEQRFIDVLGTKVLLKGHMEKGKIEISFYSQDDLNRIFEIMVPDRN